MTIRERKLFFTRNGDYSPWEMLSMLPESYLIELYKFCIDKWQIQTMPPNLEAYPWFLYSFWDSLPQIDNELFLSEVSNRFHLIPEPKSDFNAFMYSYHGISLDLESAKLNLEKLKSMSVDFEIENLEIEYFIYEEINGVKNVIDVRFVNGKTEYYKVKNEKVVNTEIRVYLDQKYALMTNFSEYTHAMSHKEVFIKEVVESVSSFRGEIKPKTLSDQLLRYLLAISNSGKLPSKLKFELEGRYTIGVDMGKPTELKDIINQESIHNIYSKGELSVVKVQLKEGDSDKLLNIIGKEGKLISRAQNLDVYDIDCFIIKLGELIKFDYLYMEYLKDIKLLARRKLTGGTDYQKDNLVYICNKNIESSIRDYCPDIQEPMLMLMKNAFYFCIKEQLFIQSSTTNYVLDNQTSSTLARISVKDKNDINKLFCSILELYKACTSDENFHINLDEIITREKAMQNVAGF